MWGFLLLALAALSAAPASAKPLMCYYGSWSVYRQGMGHYTVEDMDPHLCTHIIFTFIGLQESGEVHLLDAWNDEGDEWHEGAFTKLQKHVAANPELKVSLAVGGWNHGPRPFQVVVTDPARRAVFIESSIAMIKKYQFHGLDLDWEYQDNIGGAPEHKEGFSQLLREMKPRYAQEGLLLTSALSVNFNLIDVNYDLPVMSENLDYINVMSYDLHGAWEDHTGHLAPLYPLSTESGYDLNLNVDAIIRRLIERGANPAKLNLGFVTYGHTFNLKDAANSGPYAPSSGPGNAGEWIPEAGSYAYGELCRKWGEWTKFYIEEQRVPYAVSGSQWLGYDDVDTVRRKLDLLHSYNLAGAMVWSIETDDFRGDCGEGRYPIVTAIKNGL